VASWWLLCLLYRWRVFATRSVTDDRETIFKFAHTVKLSPGGRRVKQVKQHFDIKEKIVLITGATGGLGSALAMLAAQKGARLALTARYEEALRKLRSRLPENSVVYCRPVDLSTPGAARELAE
jgi:NADPH:quinone reductase-like Zn-dependent oxidoreductase